jgi:hypothetical protein
VGAVGLFDHGLKFGIIFLVSDHPAHEKLIASKKNYAISAQKCIKISIWASSEVLSLEPPSVNEVPDGPYIWTLRHGRKIIITLFSILLSVSFLKNSKKNFDIKKFPKFPIFSEYNFSSTGYNL